jgi:DNA polymerase I
MNTKPRVFLFDAYALIYRAYYAFINRPMINSKGINTSAIYGFTTTLTDILKKEKPDCAAVAFDPPSLTFRHRLYSEYKANRLSTPEEIKKAVPMIKRIIEAFQIKVIEVIDYEADDVIGTLAKQAEAQGYVTYMVTPDKDYMQLVSENIFMLKPSRSGNEYERIGMPEVQKFFGVDNPSKVVDVLALWGDSSDNIPGAPGIGEKSAKELISKYNSLENLLAHIHELKAKQKESLSANLQQVLLSQDLARINTEAPTSITFEEMKVRPWNDKLLMEIFRDLEFKTLTNRLLKDIQQPPVQGSLFDANASQSQSGISSDRSIQSLQHEYHVVQDEPQLDDLVAKLLDRKEFCFDTETTGLQTREAELVGIAISFKEHEAFYVPIPHGLDNAMIILDKLRPVFENPSIKKVGQNLKFDIQMLMNYHVSVEGELFDTMIAHYLIQPDFRHGLDYLAEIYLNYKMVPIEDLIGKKGSHQKNMRDIEITVIKEYAGEDADISWQLYHILNNELQKKGLSTLATTIEMPLVRVLAEMEYAGFKISKESLKSYSEILKTNLQELESKVFTMAELKFNINSPRQLGEVLFEKMKIAEGAQKTKTNQYSTGEDILVKLADKHPIINVILDYRATQKLLNTYVDALPELIDNKTGRIHTSFDQAYVSTGRLSSRNPNLQNIPIRDERGREIRKAFIAADDQHILLSADYSQIELRLMAHLSGDPNMISAFSNNADIHVSTASKIYKVPESEVTSAMRSSAKTANFGIIYGISSFGLSQRLNISRTDASALIRDYFESFPQVKEYMDNAIRVAKEKGYVETIMGRRRYLPDIHSANAIVRGVAERNAINAPIQGSAADVIKLAMVNIQKNLRNAYGTVMILQVHDELIFDVAIDELDKVRKMVKSEMEHVMKLQVPLIVDIGIGKNWLDAH